MSNIYVKNIYISIDMRPKTSDKIFSKIIDLNQSCLVYIGTMMGYLTVGLYIQKKLKDRTRIRVYGFYSLLKSQPSFLIGGEH